MIVLGSLYVIVGVGYAIYFCVKKRKEDDSDPPEFKEDVEHDHNKKTEKNRLKILKKQKKMMKHKPQANFDEPDGPSSYPTYH